MTDQSYTVNEFAKAESMSRQMVYKLWKQGQGPRFYWVGTVRRISHQARLDWQREREAETTTNIINPHLKHLQRQNEAEATKSTGAK
jgi:hypothetical protein